MKRLLLAIVLLAVAEQAQAQGSLTIPNVFSGKAAAPIASFDANWAAIAAYVNSREITLGSLAARPIAGVSGRWYAATDVAVIYEDNGVQWTALAPMLSGSATLGVGGVGFSNYDLTLRGTLTAASGGAGAMAIGPLTLNASANGNTLVGGFSTAGGTTFATGTFTGLTASQIILDGNDMVKTGSGTIDQAASLWIQNAPTIGTVNYGMRVQAGGFLGVGSLFEGGIRSVDGYRFTTDNSTTSPDVIIFQFLAGTNALQGMLEVTPATGTSRGGVPGNGAGTGIIIVPSAGSDQVSTHINSQFMLYNRPGQARWATTWYGNEVISDVTTSGSDTISNWRIVMGSTQAMLFNTSGFLGIGNGATNSNTTTELHLTRSGTGTNREFMRITGDAFASSNCSAFFETTSAAGQNYGIGQCGSTASEFVLRILPAGTYAWRATSAGSLIVPSAGIQAGAPTGGDQGAGTLNLSATTPLYVNGAPIHSTGTPTCGTGCATILTNSMDSWGGGTATAVTSITVNWSHTLNRAPFCTVSDNSTTQFLDVSSVGTTSITFGAAAGFTGTFYWNCGGAG